MTLNILRPCLVTKNMSAWDFMCGEWDYSKLPLGPAGTKVLVYENPQQRGTFADNGVEGFYLGTSTDHYRCHRVWISSTHDIRISDTLSWHLSDPFGLLSNHSAEDQVHCAVDSLTVAINDAVSPDDRAYLQRTINLLTNQLHSQRSADDIPPGLGTTPNSDTSALPVTADASVPRVLESEHPSMSHNLSEAKGPTLPPTYGNETTSSLPRVPTAPTAIAAPRAITNTNPKHSSQKAPSNPTSVSAVTAKTSLNLRSNKHHVSLDPAPTIHNAVKVIAIKGSLSTPLKPLRIRIRWQDSTPKDDTWEPLPNVKDSKAFIDYVEARPKLWYLFENCRDLQSNFLCRQQTPKLHVPISSHRADIIEKQLLTALCADPPHPCLITEPTSFDSFAPTSSQFALAAGDMDAEGQELKFKQCILGPDKSHWIKADITEYHKLFKQHEVMRPKKFSDIPAAKLPFVTYYNRQCKTKIKGDVKHYRVRGTYGGNKLSSYSGVTASYQASMTTVKMLLNKTISDEKSKFMTMEISDMYLHTKLPVGQWEHMVINLQDIPLEIIDSYKLMDFVTPGDNKVYIEVVKALYGMKQAGYLANLEVVEHLNNNGYTAPMNTPCLFRHHTDDVEFTLVTDDFGVRYGNKAAADKLLEVMSSKYPMTHDWTGTKYAGFDLLFDYSSATRRVELSMKGYILAVLRRFQHLVTTTHNVYSPEFFTPINYGSRDSQLVKELDTLPILPAAQINMLQQITGCFLYYARGVDGTMLLTVDHISREQSHGTAATLQKAIRLLEYAATFPDATIVYYPSDMILMSNVDGSYNSETNAGSRAAAFHYLGRHSDPTFINGPLECLTTVIPTVVASAAETEYASLFIGGKSLLPLRYTLDDMDCIQPSTIIITDNIAAQSIANNTCKQRRSKSMDMRYHWIRDRVKLKDFKIIWRPGAESIADYLTKTQPVAMVLKMRKFFVKEVPPTFPTSLAKRQQFNP